MPTTLPDTNLVIGHIRRLQPLPMDTLPSIVVLGELEAFALKADWGSEKLAFMQRLFQYHPVLDVTRLLVGSYATLDAYSQGKLAAQPLPPGLTARNMGKNDLWLAATALFSTSSCTPPTMTSTTSARPGCAW